MLNKARTLGWSGEGGVFRRVELSVPIDTLSLGRPNKGLALSRCAASSTAIFMRSATSGCHRLRPRTMRHKPDTGHESQRTALSVLGLWHRACRGCGVDGPV